MAEFLLLWHKGPESLDPQRAEAKSVNKNMKTTNICEQMEAPLYTPKKTMSFFQGELNYRESGFQDVGKTYVPITMAMTRA